MNNRVAARFANNQISPLHNYDRYEESCMTGELQRFTVSISLFVRKTNLHNQSIYYFSVQLGREIQNLHSYLYKLVFPINNLKRFEILYYE